MAQIKEYTLNIKRPNYMGADITLIDKGWGGWKSDLDELVNDYECATGKKMSDERKAGVQFIAIERTITVTEEEIELL